jgi:hypothetical protein
MRVIALKLNNALQIPFLILLLDCWDIKFDKNNYIGRKTSEIKFKLLEKLRETLKYLKNPYITCSLYLHTDKRVYLCPQARPKLDLENNQILGLGSWLNKLKSDISKQSEYIEIAGQIRSTDPVSKKFIENFDKMAENYKFKPLIHHINDNLRISSSSNSESDIEENTHEMVMDLNESINILNLNDEEPKPEPILRSSTLSKIVQPILKKIEKKSEKIVEGKSDESVTKFFDRLTTPKNNVENMNRLNFPFQNLETEPVSSNAFSVKTDAKNNLPEFAPEFDSAISWVEECKFIFYLLGYNNNDQKAMIGALMAKLPKELAQNVQQNLANSGIEIADLKLDNFTTVLSELTTKTDYEIEKNLEDLKIDYSNQGSYRSSYWRIKSLLKRQLGINANNPLNEKELDKIVCREFKKKLPSSTNQNLAFRMNEKCDISIADLAYQIHTLNSVGINNFRTFNSRGRGNNNNYRGFSRGQNRGSNYRGNSRSQFQNRPNFHQNSNNFNQNQNNFHQNQNYVSNRGQFRGQNRGTNYRGNSFQNSHTNFVKKCYFCGLPGHIERYCRKKSNGGRGQFYQKYN